MRGKCVSAAHAGIHRRCQATLTETKAASEDIWDVCERPPDRLQVLTVQKAAPENLFKTVSPPREGLGKKVQLHTRVCEQPRQAGRPGQRPPWACRVVPAAAVPAARPLKSPRHRAKAERPSRGPAFAFASPWIVGWFPITV